MGSTEGWVPCFWGMLVICLIFLSFFRCVLGLFLFIRLKATHCPGQYLFWGHSSAFYYTGYPSLCWPLASSGSSSRPGLADLALLRFNQPSHFRAGNIHGNSYVWQNVISDSSCGEVDLLEIIPEGVRVEHFFRPFRGNFKDIPPPVVINNSATCARFSQFISDTIIQWVTAGVIAVWGPVDVVASLYLVLPLTVEPIPDDLRRQEWLSARVVAFLVSGLFWLSVAGFLFRLPYSSFRLEGQCVYLSQARCRGFRCRSVHWGSGVAIH